MRLMTVLTLFVLGAVGVFAAANWSVFTAPTALSLLVTSVQAPLGLIMLGVAVIITGIFIVFGTYLQTSVLLDARRHARELRSQRELADQAEASRFTALHDYLGNELQKIAARDNEQHERLMSRLERLEQTLRDYVDQSGNSLAAYIGELEDRIEGRAGRAMTPGNSA